MMPGQVGKIRELNRGVEAEVCVGSSASHGYAVLKVLGTSPEVKAAMENLRAALRKEAHDSLVAAQRDAIARGRVAIGALPVGESDA